LAPDLVHRLVAINEDPLDYREMAWRHGAGFVHGFINTREEANNLYSEWSPRLRQFAEKCREANPSPTDESLSSRDRELQRIYEAKFARPLLGRESFVAICSMPLIAIPVARRVWPQDRRIVLLTPDEESKWDEIYSHPKDTFLWFSRHWWSVNDSPEQFSVGTNSFTLWKEDDIPDGGSAWLVTIGHVYGPLAGRGHTELWSWNGKRATFIKNISNWMS
jgi:hypothetical protein